MINTHRLVILGNGPSLKRDYFSNLANTACLGMNAAYRYWRRINWYPEIYCCLDDQVVVTHADAIADMIDRRLCKTFCLHHNILNVHPRLKVVPGVYILPQLRPGTNNKALCEQYGIPHIPSPLFMSLKPRKLTTGAYAVRFAAFLGFREVGLIGVDCRYVEMIKEARVVDKIVLEIQETPKTNANYFFEDYQAQGDRYNIPNPSVHEGNLHLQAFEALCEDIKHYKFDLSVKVCTSESELYDRDVFPFVPLKEFIDRPQLSAVFVPFTNRDVAHVVKNLHRWGSEAFAPYIFPSHSSRVELHFAMNGGRDDDMERALSSAYCNAGLDRYFRAVHFHYSNLSGLRDQYTRNFSGAAGPEGYMSGPNNQFFDIIQRFSRGMSHIVLLEPDAVPVRADWLNAIEEIVSGSERFWICGSHYRGSAAIQSLTHINGNAIYNVGDPEFQTFLETIFLPYFYSRIKTAPHICYDIVLHDMFASVYAGKGNSELLSTWKKIVHRFRYSEFIVDLSHSQDRTPKAMLSLADVRIAFPDAVLVHGAVENLLKEDFQTYVPTQKCLSVDEDGLKADVLMFDPDALGHRGHYLNYDDQLYCALNAYSRSFTTIVNRQFPAHLANSRQFMISGMTDHSWSIGIPVKDGAVSPEALLRFELEVRDCLNQLSKRSPKRFIRIYQYCAGLPHAQVIAKVLIDFPNASAVINLFYLPFQGFKGQPFNKTWGTVLRNLAQNPKLILTSPTTELSDELNRIYGVHLETTPHPSPTISDVLFANLQSDLRIWSRRIDDRCLIYFPGTPTIGKGQETALAAASFLSGKTIGTTVLDVAVRDGRKENTPVAITELFNNLPVGVEVIHGELTNEEFLDLFLKAHVVVLPYTANMFKYRNSGLLVDGLYCGKPAVVMKGTWLAGIVERTGCGVVVDSESPISFFQAIKEIVGDYENFQKRARDAARAYFVQNSWEALARLIVAPNEQASANKSVATTLPVDVKAALFAPEVQPGAKPDSVSSVPAVISNVSTKSEKLSIQPPKIEKRSRTLVVLGNGPSLKDFDFKRFKAFDVVGMNVAYRYWDRIGWYPRYYICLDKVVGLSHKDQIARLIRDRASNGIECFMLRRNLLDVLPSDLASLDCVLDFEALQATSDLFSTTPITTGSHASLFGTLLGYDRMILMGVDCNYVDRVEGAKERGGTVLELVRTPAENPNYFFDGYQVAGDRFNIPNPGPDMHLISWQHVAPVLAARGVKVWNGGRDSRVDLFPKLDFVEIERVEAVLRKADRLVVQMDKSPAGENWYLPENNEHWGSYCWSGPGARATLSIPVKLDREMLAVVAFHAPLIKKQLTGLHIEVDGVHVPHAVVSDVSPQCIVARIAARKGVVRDGAIEFALVVPRTVSPSSLRGGSTDQRLLGLAVSSVSVIPAEPALSTKHSIFSGAINFLLPYFDGLAYLEANPDLAESVVAGRIASALEHYRKHGRKERRGFTLAQARVPNEGGIAELFDGLAYLDTYPDVADAVRSETVPSALEHFLRHGRKEGRQVYTRFDGAARRGTAFDLVRLDTTRDATAGINGLKTQLGGQITAQSGVLGSQLTKLESVVSKLAPASNLDTLKSEVERIDRTSREAMARAQAQLTALTKAREAREQALLAQVDSLKAEIGAAKTRAELTEAKVASAHQDLSAGARDVAGSLSDLGTRLQAEQSEVARLQTELGAIKNQVVATNARVSHANLDAFNVLGYQAHPRALLKASAERLSKHWAPLLGLNIQEKELYYLAHRVCSLENACIGRLATSVNDILLRTLVARSVRSRTLDIMEIGTLFGLGVGALHEALAPLYQRVHFTAIDPLDGYYGKENRDVLTGVPVTRNAFDENLRRMGIGSDKVTLIQRLSTDPKAAKQARKAAYDLIVVDGDHSYAGVKQDCDLYASMVKPGGYLLFDDYGNQYWPGVKQYVDAEVMSRNDLKFIGAEWHTAVFQVAPVGGG